MEVELGENRRRDGVRDRSERAHLFSSPRTTDPQRMETTSEWSALACSVAHERGGWVGTAGLTNELPRCPGVRVLLACVGLVSADDADASIGRASRRPGPNQRFANVVFARRETKPLYALP
jgi:hypothetical protein